MLWPTLGFVKPQSLTVAFKLKITCKSQCDDNNKTIQNEYIMDCLIV